MKTLLFIIDFGMTIGDQKPLAILAVYAASQLNSKIILACFDPGVANKWLFSIERFAEYMIGPDYKKYIDIQYDSQINRDDFINFLTFGCSIYEIKGYIPLDFGDNFSNNRFTSKILSRFKPNANFFGSLFLPIYDGIFWSNDGAVNELKTIQTLTIGRKIITIAGSLRPAFDILEIFEWLKLNQKQTKWFIVLIGFNDHIIFYKLEKQVRQYSKLLYLMQNFVEYEDLVSISDFFVSNCGAGSVIAEDVHNYVND